ncbi:MAG TPA: VOC family protein [Actinophytocola sp.]|nr:VOC family protein [Actinophytocola sp.]
MTDPFDALYEPAAPVDPAPEFAARLRQDLIRELLGDAMTQSSQVEHEPAWPPSLSPYIVVSDARAALAWYTEVFGARQRGELYVNADGTVGHAEVGLGDAVLMFAEPSDLWPDVPVRAPSAPSTFSHTLHLSVDDVDATVATARRRAATVEREPVDEPYGRAAVIVDPFGHRWMLNTPPARATRLRQGDVARVTVVTPDVERARTFYEAVLEVPFAPGSVPGAWVAETSPPVGMWSPPGQQPQVQLCFRVDDVEAAVARVRAAGGRAEDAERKPYGLLAECADDQGARFQLWQPVD